MTIFGPVWDDGRFQSDHLCETMFIQLQYCFCAETGIEVPKALTEDSETHSLSDYEGSKDESNTRRLNKRDHVCNGKVNISVNGGNVYVDTCSCRAKKMHRNGVEE